MTDKTEGDGALAWLIEYDGRRVAHLHNAVGDYRDIDPDATSAPLVLKSDLAAAIAREEADSRRLDWLWRDSGVEGFVNVTGDVYDYAQDVADEHGRDEPSREDFSAGFRRLIDAAIAAQQAEGEDS